MQLDLLAAGEQRLLNPATAVCVCVSLCIIALRRVSLCRLNRLALQGVTSSTGLFLSSTGVLDSGI